jgi:hypothetical protein
VSIAWSTVAFLVLLLPGFLFFVGLYLPENFTRETAPRSAFGQLAATVLVAFLVHGLLYALSWSLSADWIPHVRLNYLLQLLQVEALTDREFAEIVRNIEEFRWWVFLYVIGTCLLGLWAGYETGCLIVGGPLRRLAEHAWVYDLRVEGGTEKAPGLILKLAALARAAEVGLARRLPGGVLHAVRAFGARLSGSGLRTVTVTYVLTDVGHDGRHIMYRGFLKAFGISKEGKPLYLVLSNVMRSYMLLKAEGPETGGAQNWRLIGSTTEPAPDLPGPRLSSYLTVSGEHITNVVFDRHAFQQTAAGMRKLESAYAESLRSERAEAARPPA